MGVKGMGTKGHVPDVLEAKGKVTLEGQEACLEGDRALPKE